MSYKNKILIANPSITDPVFAEKVVLVISHDEKGASGIVLNGPSVGNMALADVKNGERVDPEDHEAIARMIRNNQAHVTSIKFGGPCSLGQFYMLHGYEQFNQLSQNGNEDDNEFDLGIPQNFDVWDGGENPSYNDASSNEDFRETKVTQGIYFGAPVVLGHILHHGLIEEKKFKIFTGNAVWEAGQLEEEIEGGAWTFGPPITPKLFFNDSFIDNLVIKAPKKWEDFLRKVPVASLLEIMDKK